MQIAYKRHEDCDFFYFDDHSKITASHVLLPNEIPTRDLLFLMQASLDQIRPVVLLGGQTAAINLSELKSKHFHLEKEQYIFLNYSIRNSLSNVQTGHTNISSFKQMYEILSHHFAINT